MTTWVRNTVGGVTATVVAAVIGFLLLAWLGHFDATAQTEAKAKENSERADKQDATMEKVVVVLESLSAIHTAEEAKQAMVAELCRSGKLDDCADCARAGIELDRCTN